jgi:murein DD-endopeptidase MepM/ murein hydrolase activator NlpD
MPLLACEYRNVANTQGSRLLVSDSPSSTFKVVARLHPADQIRVLSQSAGRRVSDPALGKASSQWLKVTYPYGAGQQTGWINEMYATCLTQCTYLEVQNVGTRPLLVKDTPYPAGRVVHRLYNNYVVKSIGSVADGILISDSTLNSSSKLWYKIEYYDGASGLEKQGWISSLYTFCTHGRMNSTNGSLKLPVASRLLTSTEADHKRRGSVNAWDINAAYGSPVRPISPGKVSYVGCNNAGGYGCWTYIAHDNGLFSIMAHMIDGSLRVKAGDRVTQDTVVGRVGWTGFTTFGPHVHLEIISGGVKVLPGNYFDLNSMAYCVFCSLKK